ncbi:hypothetical protein BpHYR1_027457, partial [Brachionus plicatilis]
DKVVSNCESFINAQKENIKCKQDHINKFYEALCKTMQNVKDKSKFWKFINKQIKTRTYDSGISLSLDSLFENFKKIFNETFSLDSEKRLIKSKVDETLNGFKPGDFIPEFDLDTLEKVISESKNSTVKGYDQMSYSLLKNSTWFEFKIVVLEFFNQILRFHSVPDYLNIAKITPILKDQSKNHNDLGNIRPISVSNCFAQIFEKLILHSCPGLRK